jgi:uncharacterized protein (TIGR03085 family)
MPLDAVEREELCDLFTEVGPAAPTLCEGWLTLDLAAHLALRERDPRAGLAIIGGSRFASLEERLMTRAKEQGFSVLVDRIRRGPPLPMRVPGLRDTLNLNEYFVHHEDVRRPNGRGPRTDRPDLDEALWRFLRIGSRFQLRRVHASVTLEAPGRAPIRAGKGPTAVLRGTPQEIVLYLNGRRGAADVAVDGDEAGQAALRNARLGV